MAKLRVKRTRLVAVRMRRVARRQVGHGCCTWQRFTVHTEHVLMIWENSHVETTHRVVHSVGVRVYNSAKILFSTMPSQGNVQSSQGWEYCTVQCWRWVEVLMVCSSTTSPQQTRLLTSTCGPIAVQPLCSKTNSTGNKSLSHYCICYLITL